MRKLLFAALTVLAVGSFAIAPAFVDGQSGEGQGNTGQGEANGTNGNDGQGASRGGTPDVDKGHERDDNGHPGV